MSTGAPAARQIFAPRGIGLARTSLAHWMILARQLVQPLINLFHERLVENDVVQADETSLQVLKEPGRAAKKKSSLWLYRTGTSPPIVLYDYQTSRAGVHAKRYSSGFGGYLQTDGHCAYDQIGDDEHRPVQLGC